jgi:hypothetical protein
MIDDDRRMHWIFQARRRPLCDKVHGDAKRNPEELPKAGAGELPDDVAADVHPNKVVMQMTMEASVNSRGDVGLL